MKRIHIARGGLIAFVLVSMLGFFGTPASAELTDTTTGSVTVKAAGKLEIYWKNGDTQFLNNGNPPAVSATTSADATAIFPLIIDDSRTDDNRSGYTVSLSASKFDIENGPYSIPPSQITVSSLTGVPEGLSSPLLAGSSLDDPTTVLIVPAAAPAVNATINIAITISIPVGTPPGTYSGKITVDVIPQIES